MYGLMQSGDDGFQAIMGYERKINKINFLSKWQYQDFYIFPLYGFSFET